MLHVYAVYAIGKCTTLGFTTLQRWFLGVGASRIGPYDCYDDYDWAFADQASIAPLRLDIGLNSLLYT